MNLTTLKGEFYGSICPVPSHSFYAPQGPKKFTPEEDARYSKGVAFYLLTENAINELHNNGIIARLLPESAVLVHDPNPFTRTTVKQYLAHQIANDYVKELETSPFSNSKVPVTSRWVEPEEHFSNCIALRIQKMLEFTHLEHQKEFESKGMRHPVCLMMLDTPKARSLLEKLALLDSMYPDIYLMVFASKSSDASDVLNARRVQLANYAAPASGLK